MGRCSEKCVVNSTNRDSKLYFCVQILVQTGFEKTLLFSKPQIDGCMVVWLLFRGVVLRFITEIQYYYD